MRVAFVAPSPWETISGGYVYDRAMVEALRDTGHDVLVVALAGRHPLADDTAHQAAAAAWARLETDRAVVIDGLCLPAFAPLAEALATRDVVGLIHHPTALETGRTEPTRESLLAIERSMFARLRRIVVTSADTSQRLVSQFGVLAPRIAVVEPGVPAASRSRGPMRESCAILSVGTLLPRKGHDVLLRALGRLIDLEWTLVIAGGAPDPELAESLCALSASLGIEDRVRFAGEVAPPDLEPLWEEAGMFALATWYEGYGMAIAEALRRGVPVAVTAGGAAAALAAPECSVVCPPGDHAGLARAMRRVIYDHRLRHAMADAAWRLGAALPDWTAQGKLFAAALEAP